VSTSPITTPTAPLNRVHVMWALETLASSGFARRHPCVNSQICRGQIIMAKLLRIIANPMTRCEPFISFLARQQPNIGELMNLPDNPKTTPLLPRGAAAHLPVLVMVSSSFVRPEYPG
jgi:hypothetical protein